MNSIQNEMLKKLGQFSRNHGYFCAEFQLKPATCSFYLEDLQERGYIAQIKTGYKLTQKGRNYMDGSGKAVESHRYGNASTTGEFNGIKWVDIRAGAGEKSPNGRCA